MKINLKLGESGPEMPSMKEMKDKKYYPSLHITSKEKLDLPEDGLMTIRYHKSQSSMTDDEENGKRYSCTIEAKEIVSAESDEVEPPTKRNRESEDALDMLMEEKKSKY